MFNDVTSRANFPDMEEDILRFWKENDIFLKSCQKGDKGKFMLFEGPPTANGSPGMHHVLARVFKDIICRYKSMKGYQPYRKGGWDTHGLPVELEVEKELGLTSKKDIEDYGIEKFNKRCRESVFRYVKEWEDLTNRIGYWIDMENPYRTLDNSYIETCWWILKELWDKGLVYKGMKATPHCPRCACSLSSHEVAQGYQENTKDPSVFVKFRVNLKMTESESLKNMLPDLSEETKIYLMAWTTTPWTLPANTALAIQPKADYSIVKINLTESDSEFLILASDLVSKILDAPYELTGTIPGKDLIGLSYVKLFNPLDYGISIQRFQRPKNQCEGEYSVLGPETDFQPGVIGADYVSLEDGTGIVHIAPAFGEEDIGLGRKHGLPFVQHVNLQGLITGSYEFSGKFVKDADSQIINSLEERTLLYRQGTYLHTYPFCWRCKSPLLYYAKESWYIQTTAMKTNIISNNDKISWHPEHIKQGRFGDWLRGGVDWAISRERYWGTPLPIWQCDDCKSYTCVGSLSELEQKVLLHHKKQLADLDLHRPYIDEIAIVCSICGGTSRRTPEVMDAWYDSGAMPYAQWHAISNGQIQELEKNSFFPADYICEAVDQTRGWFYSLLALSTLLLDQPSYKNVICLGLILDEKGRKMSKSQGNVVDPWEIINNQGADATRWYLFTTTQPGDSRRFSQRLVSDVIRRFFLTLWNVYSFFITYAQIDQFRPTNNSNLQDHATELDRWIISELNALVEQVDISLDSYDPTNGGRRIQEFVDILSNWYVRRSRRRFWRSDNDENKLVAYQTLYTCLTTLSRLMAPFTPFLSETMYQNLVVNIDKSASESVHLVEYPKANLEVIDQSLMEATRLAMKISRLGRDARSRAGKKVRLPLSRILVNPREESEAHYIEAITTQVMEELNVKELVFLDKKDPLYHRISDQTKENRSTRIDELQIVTEGGYTVALDTTITDDLMKEGVARELVHRIQNMRKNAGFQVTEQIKVFYKGDKTLEKTMEEYEDYIKSETLSLNLIESNPVDDAYVEHQSIEGEEIVLGVLRSS